MTITIVRGITAVAIVGSGVSFNETTVTSNYVATSSDNYIYVNQSSGSGISVTLPASPSTNQFIVIKDVAGNASTKNITITGTVDGTTNSVIGANYGGAGLSWNGSSWSEIF